MIRHLHLFFLFASFVPVLSRAEVGELEPAESAAGGSVPPVLILDWNSRYVTEGRDNLAGEGLWGTAVEMELGSFLYGGWLATSDGAQYEELNLLAEYAFEAFDLDWYVSYTHLQFLSDKSDDNETGIGFEVPGFPFSITPALNWYYSFNSDGSFLEASISRETAVNERLTLVPALIYGRNDGYITRGHNGANHIALQLGADFTINDQVTLAAVLSQNFALSSDQTTFPDDALLKDFFYGGVAFSITIW